MSERCTNPRLTPLSAGQTTLELLTHAPIIVLLDGSTTSLISCAFSDVLGQVCRGGGVYVWPEAPAHPQIKRELRRRAAIEPVIGHLKAEHRMGRNYLAHRAGDAVNAVLAAAGYNFHLLLKWLELLPGGQRAAADLQWVGKPKISLTPSSLVAARPNVAGLPDDPPVAAAAGSRSAPLIAHPAIKERRDR